MDDSQDEGAGGLDELLAGLEQSSADEGEKDAGSADVETKDEPQDDKAPADDADKSGDAGEDEGDEDGKRRKPSGAERARRRIERLEAELAAERARRPEPAGGDEDAIKAAVEREIGPPPKESDFSDFLEFESARTAYNVEKRLLEREVRKDAAKSADVKREQFRAIVEDHNDRLDDLEKAVPGSRAKIAAAGEAKVAPHVVPLLLDSEKSALLQLHLAEKPDVLAALNRMPPVQAAREIGRLEARLSLPKPRTETKAPAPVRSVRGAASPGFDPERAGVADMAKHLGLR